MGKGLLSAMLNTRASQLKPEDWELLRRLHAAEPLAFVDRKEDRARQRCRSLGLVNFNRAVWKWELTNDGTEISASRAARARMEDGRN